jgi:hypothetical protein
VFELITHMEREARSPGRRSRCGETRSTAHVTSLVTRRSLATSAESCIKRIRPHITPSAVTRSNDYFGGSSINNFWATVLFFVLCVLISLQARWKAQCDSLSGVYPVHPSVSLGREIKEDEQQVHDSVDRPCSVVPGIPTTTVQGISFFRASRF